MQTQKILDNLDKFPVLPEDLHLVNDILLALFDGTLGTSDSEEVLPFLADKTFQLRCIYHLHVDEAHFCQLYILSVDGVPLTFYGRHGHEDSAWGEATILNKAQAVSLAQQVAAGLMQRRLAKFSEENDGRIVPDNLLKLGGSPYLCALSSSVFGARDEFGGLNNLTQAPFSAWYRTGDTVVPVTSFDHRREGRDYRLFALTEEGEVAAESGRLMFQFLDSEQDRDEAASRMSAAGDWFVDGKESTAENIPMAIVYERANFNWSYGMRVLTFKNKGDYHAFIKKYPFDTLTVGAFPRECVEGKASIV